MKQAFRSRLLAAPAMSQLVDDRIDWGMSPQGSPTPRVALHLISGPLEDTFEGRRYPNFTRVQLNAIADDYETADAIVNAAIGIFETPGEVDGIIFMRPQFEHRADQLARPETSERITIPLDIIVGWQPA